MITGSRDERQAMANLQAIADAARKLPGRRERIATIVLSGIAAADLDVSFKSAAIQSIGFADALIAELDK